MHVGIEPSISSFRMMGYIRMLGGVDSSVHLVSYRGQRVNANIGTGNFNGVNVVYGRVPPCKIKGFPRGQTPARIPIRGARGNRTLDFQLSDDRIHPKAGVSIPPNLGVDSVVHLVSCREWVFLGTARCVWC